MGDVTDISVVIPTRERWPVLRRTLELLEQQELGGGAAELVVVDNGSRDGSAAELERWAADPVRAPAVRALNEPKRGPAAARNAGVRAARGRIVLFLGDDCRPASRSLLAGHLAAHEGDPCAVVGLTEWDPELDATPVMRWLMRSGKQFDFDRAERDRPGPWLFYTSNVSLPRESIAEAGWFDERFPSAAWEDYELALRLEEHGLRFAWRRDLVVHHHHHYGLHDSLRHMEEVGRSANLLNRLQAHRRPLPAPAPAGIRADVGRMLAPLALRLPEPPPPMREPWFRAAHFAALARGYSRGQEPNDATERAHGGDRPAVSVVVPFAGDAAGARALAEALERLDLREGDEAIVVDNTPDGVLGGSCGPARVLHDAAERSSYHARNAGGRAARNPWLLFLDADCVPRPGLLAAYLAETPPAGVGALAGSIHPAEAADTAAARYARTRTHLDQVPLLQRPDRPFAVTANLLVRRDHWLAVGGFAEGVRSGGDADFCLRLQRAGHALHYRDEAAVEHRHRESVRGILRTAARYGAGRAWLDRRAEGHPFRPRPLRVLARAVLGALVWTAGGRLEKARFKLLDGAVALAETAGYALANVPPGARREPAEIVLMPDSYPTLSETFVSGEAAALAALGRRVRVEATSRPAAQNLEALGAVPAGWVEDDGIARRLVDCAWLVATRPLAAARDLRDSLRWRREERVAPLHSIAPAARRVVREGRPHLQAHFAAEAALRAMRIARLTGATWGVTAHAYDIFREPRNLEEKLAAADLVVTVCEYNARHLRGLVPDGKPVEVVVMGVEPARFRRTTPYPGGRRVLAVGRLVEKKGFAHLVEAAALLDGVDVEIVGDGPLRRDLEMLIAARGVAGRVTLHGARPHSFVRERLEHADLLAMPCVIAADGDRDSMPVVVKEALAMEVPVVASDEVALPEMVEPGWGRLVPPADPTALAAAIEELLALPAGERAAMGRRGREFVAERFSLAGQAQRLAELVDATRARDT